jgi:poly-gamma-glutamate capsule biosynthesis protein CapA/YwtB (metallophosphatase superfamily)
MAHFCLRARTDRRGKRTPAERDGRPLRRTPRMFRAAVIAGVTLLVAGEPSAFAQTSSEHGCVTLIAAGDILLDRGVRTRAGIEDDPRYPLQTLPTLWQPNDLVLANLECPLTRRSQPASKRYVFRCEPAMARAMRRAGIDLLTLGNNHVHDQGRAGILDTLRHLRSAGIVAVGAGRNLAHAHAPRIIQRGGARIALLGFVTIPLEGIIFADDQPTPAIATEELVMRSLARARSLADIVVVTVHWGRELHHAPSADQRRWASFFRHHGADLVIGHHPHVLQTVQQVNGRWTFYSLGNFIFDQRRRATRLSALARVRVCRDAPVVRAVDLVPLELEKTRPIAARPRNRRAIRKLLGEVSPEIRFSELDNAEPAPAWQLRSSL